MIKPLIMAVSICFLFLTGFEFFKEVELSYKKPLIDLYGNSSSENPSLYTEAVNTEKESTPSEENTKKENTAGRSAIREVHIIGIRYKTITWDGRECDIKELEDNLKKFARAGTEIRLLENYAEYHTFSSAYSLIMEYKEKNRFDLTEHAMEEKK